MDRSQGMHTHRPTQLRRGRPTPSFLCHCTPLNFHNCPMKHLWVCCSSVPKYSKKNASLLQFCAEVQPEERTAVAVLCRSKARRTHRCCSSVPKYSKKNAPLLQFCAEVQPEERTAVAVLCLSTARRTHRCCSSVPKYSQKNAPLLQFCAEVQPEERTDFAVLC